MTAASLLLKKEKDSSLIQTHGVDKILSIRCSGKMYQHDGNQTKLISSVGIQQTFRRF